jgi:gas vesicle protein
MSNPEKTAIGDHRTRELACVFLGMGIGIAATLLLAPQSGTATRRLIGRKVKDGEHWLKGKATSAEAYVQTRGADIRDRVKEVAEVVSRS